ncbi:MAG: hypothetical protein KGL44_10815 [Sphingomonadales bacterium]|nr:hypothetical protein [Sphingomonadales bacterium]
MVDPMPTSSRWLNDPRIREWAAFHSLRRNDPAHSLIEGLGEMVQAVDEVRDRERIEALIAEERRRNPVVDRWFEERFVSTYTLADLARHPVGSLGQLLHDYMAELGLSLELLPQRAADPHWSPASDLDYYTLRSGQTHDFDHMIGECGFDCIGEVFPAGLRAGNLFAHLSPELAGALHTTTMFVTFPWLMRTMLHYPQIWNTVWDNFAHGHDVGRASPPLFTVKWEDYLHLSPAEARQELGIKGFRGPMDNRAASLIFGEGRLII